ncbi:MAG: hypothetical protein K6U02_04795 [Firmicutes bacterium]|nr:hypothetical protein [Bacillota bacterium]
METRKVQVLLAGESVADTLSVAEFLHNWGCEARVVTSLAEAQQLVSRHACDLVLSQVRLRDGSAFPLIAYLAGSPVTLFFFQPVHEGCWWLPALRRGHYCWGSPAMRPGEFVRVLGEILREIATEKTEPQPLRAVATGVPESVIVRPRPVPLPTRSSAPRKAQPAPLSPPAAKSA